MSGAGLVSLLAACAASCHYPDMRCGLMARLHWERLSICNCTVEAPFEDKVSTEAVASSVEAIQQLRLGAQRAQNTRRQKLKRVLKRHLQHLVRKQRRDRLLESSLVCFAFSIPGARASVKRATGSLSHSDVDACQAWGRRPRTPRQEPQLTRSRRSKSFFGVCTFRGFAASFHLEALEAQQPPGSGTVSSSAHIRSWQGSDVSS